MNKIKQKYENQRRFLRDFPRKKIGFAEENEGKIMLKQEKNSLINSENEYEEDY
jgi:hypothetical protein